MMFKMSHRCDILGNFITQPWKLYKKADKKVKFLTWYVLTLTDYYYGICVNISCILSDTLEHQLIIKKPNHVVKCTHFIHSQVHLAKSGLFLLAVNQNHLMIHGRVPQSLFNIMGHIWEWGGCNLHITKVILCICKRNVGHWTMSRR